MIDPNEFNSSDCKTAQTLLQTYLHFKEDIRQGKYRLTQNILVTLYGSNTASVTWSIFRSENNYNAWLYCWKFFLIFYFALNRTNYARYESLYVSVLQNIENIYPGLKILETKGLSVQARNRYPLRLAKQIFKLPFIETD